MSGHGRATVRPTSRHRADGIMPMCALSRAMVRLVSRPRADYVKPMSAASRSPRRLGGDASPYLLRRPHGASRISKPPRPHVRPHLSLTLSSFSFSPFPGLPPEAFAFRAERKSKRKKKEKDQAACPKSGRGPDTPGAPPPQCQPIVDVVESAVVQVVAKNSRVLRLREYSPHKLLARFHVRVVTGLRDGRDLGRGEMAADRVVIF